VTTRTGHVIAWISFALGVTVSIAANVLHADLDGSTTPELAGSAFWPLALLLSIEVLTRVTWPTGLLWGIARFGGVGLVALVAAVLSYRHMAGLLGSWGEDRWNSHLGPLAVDGLMLVSATALLAISKAKAPAETTAPARVVRVPWRVQLVRLGDLRIPAVSLDRAVLAYAEPVQHREVVTEQIPDRPLLPDLVDPNVEMPPTDATGGWCAPTHAEFLGEPELEPKPSRPHSQPVQTSGDEKAYAFWETERAAGRTPSVRQVAEASGLPVSTAGRRVKAWKANEARATADAR
jgi:hypothetical protein